MARKLLKRLIKVSQRFRSRQRIAGFTLLELLVSIIIGSLITVLLLGLVIDLAEANQRDASRSQVQQDMQAAIDYMTQDLREAVFVYNGQCVSEGGATLGETTCPGIVNHIPEELTQNGHTPVLAFWRTDPLPAGIAQFCADNVAGLASGDADNPVNQANLGGVCLAGRTYSLIVYVLDTSNDASWAGQAQIRRFKLTRFQDDATDGSNTGLVPGYVDPIRDPALTFQVWPLDKSGDSEQATRPNLTNSPAPVLVDFVSQEGAFTAAPSCQEFGDDATEQANALSPLGSTNPGFYVCVRGGGLGATRGQNQDILLSLVGNLTGKPGYTNVGPKVSPVQTRVLVRGVLGK